MPQIKIPLVPPGIVDVLGLLGLSLKNPGRRIRNGDFLWCTSAINETVIMSREMADEIFKLARTYRYFYRVSQADPLTLPGLTMAEWQRLRAEADELCRELDRIYPGR